jgi:carbon monoxide dehydrogenase subunit G
MLRFEGDKAIARPLSEVWSKLSDAHFLVQCIPDVDSVQRAEADLAELTIRPGLSFVRGNLDTTVRIHDKNEPNAMQIDLISKGIGSSSTVVITLEMAAADEETFVHWIAEVRELGGLLKLVPSGLIKGAAQKVISDVWERAVQQLEQGDQGASGS